MILKIVHFKMYPSPTLINLFVNNANDCNGTLSDFTAKEEYDCSL